MEALYFLKIRGKINWINKSARSYDKQSGDGKQQ